MTKTITLTKDQEVLVCFAMNNLWYMADTDEKQFQEILNDLHANQGLSSNDIQQNYELVETVTTDLGYHGPED